MVRRFKLRQIDSEVQDTHEKNGVIDRREFMRLSFNTAAGLITTASLGAVGFASFLMGQAGVQSSTKKPLRHIQQSRRRPGATDEEWAEGSLSISSRILPLLRFIFAILSVRSRNRTPPGQPCESPLPDC